MYWTPLLRESLGFTVMTAPAMETWSQQQRMREFVQGRVEATVVYGKRGDLRVADPNHVGVAVGRGEQDVPDPRLHRLGERQHHIPSHVDPGTPLHGNGAALVIITIYGHVCYN